MFHGKADRQVSLIAIRVRTAAEENPASVPLESEFRADQDPGAEEVPSQDIDQVRLFEGIGEGEEVTEREQKGMVKYRQGQDYGERH